MKKPTKRELQLEARSLRRFLTDPELVKWFWPWQHAKAVQKVRDHDSAWYSKNAARILPALPVQPIEANRVLLERRI